MTNRPNVSETKGTIVGLIGARVSNEQYGKLDQKKARVSNFRKLTKPDFHETMFEAGRLYCEADPGNYSKMRSLFGSYVISEVKDKSKRVNGSPLYSASLSVGLNFINTKQLNLKFSAIDPKTEMVAFGEDEHEYAIRCAIYVLAGMRMRNGSAPPIASNKPYTT